MCGWVRRPGLSVLWLTICESSIQVPMTLAGSPNPVSLPFWHGPSNGIEVGIWRLGWEIGYRGWGWHSKTSPHKTTNKYGQVQIKCTRSCIRVHCTDYGILLEFGPESGRELLGYSFPASVLISTCKLTRLIRQERQFYSAETWSFLHELAGGLSTKLSC